MNIIKLTIALLLGISALIAEEIPATKQITEAKEKIVTAPEKATQVKETVAEVKKEVTAVEATPAPAKVTQEKAHNITIPKVPEVPKAIQLTPEVIRIDSRGNITHHEENIKKLYPKRKKIIFSSNVAPERFRKKKTTAQKEVLAGDIVNARVTAYLQSPLLEVKEVKEKLQSAGFEIVSTFKVDKKGAVTSIVFTNDVIKKAAAKDIRGFAGTLRVVVDTKNNLVNISNPIYIMKAFMQKEYVAKVAEDTLKQIRSVFSDLKNSTEVVKFLALERYQFMENMPYYQDMKVIAKAKNEELLKRAKKSKKIVYTQTLENGSIVIGVKLGKRTSKFVKKIGYTNSGILPYPVLIEKGEAKIMAPQYYIAVMYPTLKMSKFMTIATVPGAITKDIDRIFR